MKRNFDDFSERIKAANVEFLKRRVNLLEKHRKAYDLLIKSGYQAETIRSFYLGLSDEYTDSERIVHANALVAPVINNKGKILSKSVYFNLPGVTINPADENCWFRGSPITYYSGAYINQKSIFVCSRIKDLWLLVQLIDGTPLEQEIIFIASTSTVFLPPEWHDPEYWKRFENIYLAFPAGKEDNESVTAISKIAGNNVKRVFPANENNDSWKSFCRRKDSNYMGFQKILDKTQGTKPKFDFGQNELVPGRYGYQPIDIAGAFHNGFLYYPIETLDNTLETYRNEDQKSISEILSKKEVVLIRSDRTVQEVIQVPAPRGTPLNKRILRLTDGTLIESHPKTSAYSTWSWESIENFRDNVSKTRSLRAILSDVRAFLGKNVWLPSSYDYDLLTLLVPVTFAQAVFQSVPLILVTGPPGSGKSALGRAMVQICANAATVGQISAAAIARLIDETKGFVVFDDLESIGKRKGRDAGSFSELVQSLKLSYNKQTSWKTWTDMSSGGSVKRLNFYGVKMINNTTGADHILGSRLLKVYMRKMPHSLQQSFGSSEEWNPVILSKLRDELHTWTFENVGLIDEIYRRLFSSILDRDAEITAPLKVFAKIAGDIELEKGLNRALTFQNCVSNTVDNPISLLKEAVKRLIISGYTNLSPTHISLEMKYIASENSLLSSEDNPKWKSVIWLGRSLRLHGVVEINALSERNYLYGKSLRIYPLSEKYVAKVLTTNKDYELTESRKALDFCSVCEECVYKNISCPIRDSRFGIIRTKVHKQSVDTALDR